MALWGSGVRIPSAPPAFAQAKRGRRLPRRSSPSGGGQDHSIAGGFGSASQRNSALIRERMKAAIPVVLVAGLFAAITTTRAATPDYPYVDRYRFLGTNLFDIGPKFGFLRSRANPKLPSPYKTDPLPAWKQVNEVEVVEVRGALLFALEVIPIYGQPKLNSLQAIGAYAGEVYRPVIGHRDGPLFALTNYPGALSVTTGSRLPNMLVTQVGTLDRGNERVILYDYGVPFIPAPKTNAPPTNPGTNPSAK